MVRRQQRGGPDRVPEEVHPLLVPRRLLLPDQRLARVVVEDDLAQPRPPPRPRREGPSRVVAPHVEPEAHQHRPQSLQRPHERAEAAQRRAHRRAPRQHAVRHAAHELEGGADAECGAPEVVEELGDRQEVVLVGDEEDAHRQDQHRVVDQPRRAEVRELVRPPPRDGVVGDHHQRPRAVEDVEEAVRQRVEDVAVHADRLVLRDRGDDDDGRRLHHRVGHDDAAAAAQHALRDREHHQPRHIMRVDHEVDTTRVHQVGRRRDQRDRRRPREPAPRAQHKRRQQQVREQQPAHRHDRRLRRVHVAVVVRVHEPVDQREGAGDAVECAVGRHGGGRNQLRRAAGGAVRADSSHLTSHRRRAQCEPRPRSRWTAPHARRCPPPLSFLAARAARRRQICPPPCAHRR